MGASDHQAAELDKSQVRSTVETRDSPRWQGRVPEVSAISARVEPDSAAIETELEPEPPAVTQLARQRPHVLHNLSPTPPCP
jgi:hypothetical protein